MYMHLHVHMFMHVYYYFRTRVNGQIVTSKTQLKHGSRLLFGNNHLYRLSCPRRGGASFDEEEPVMNYEQAMKEISVNEMAAGE